MTKHYKIVAIDNGPTIPQRRVVYEGTCEGTARRFMDQLQFTETHEVYVDGKAQSFTLVVPR